MNSTKEKYERLLLLHNQLCNVSNEIDYLRIIGLLKNEISLIQQYYLFPVELPDNFYKFLDGIIESYEKDKFYLSKELYVYLAKLMFRFEEVNIYTVAPYRKILELGRTMFPYEEAMTWGIEYQNELHFSHELFYFQINSVDLFKLTTTEYKDYQQRLRISNKSIEDILPIEEDLPSDLYSNVNKELEKRFSEYQKYICENYPSIKRVFLYYNKKICLYIHQRNDSYYIAMMNVYENTHAEIKVCPHWVNLMYRFYNVENFTSKISSGCLWGIDPHNQLDFSSIFGLRHIYYELNNIFVKNASTNDLRDYFCYLERGQLKDVKIQNENQFEVIIDKEKYLLILQDIPTASILENKLKEYSTQYKGIIFRFRPDREICSLLTDSKISIVVIADMGRNLIDIGNGEMLHWFIKHRLNQLHIDPALLDISHGELLIDKLRHCPEGREGWSKYEDIGGEIFTYLFENCFRNYKADYQSKTISGIFRRDMLVNNTYNSEPSFWKRIESDFGSKIIIIDFKNYQDPLNSDELHNVSKYFNKIVGNFAIIFSRHGLDETAQKYQLELLSENKLVLCLSEEDIMDMIRLKNNGQNPTDSLENMYYSLCKKK